jgi:hypothetical protein
VLDDLLRSIDLAVVSSDEHGVDPLRLPILVFDRPGSCRPGQPRRSYSFAASSRPGGQLVRGESASASAQAFVAGVPEHQALIARPISCKPLAFVTPRRYAGSGRDRHHGTVFIVEAHSGSS